MRTLEIRDTFQLTCSKRNDACGIDVESRMHMCNDLVESEAAYHKVCHDAFLKGSDIPAKNDRPQLSTRTCNADKLAVFEQLCEWLVTADG